MYQPIELTDAEKELYERIDWEMIATARGEYEDRIANLEVMAELAKSLLERDAIPQVRWDYFTKSEMFVGGHGKSRVQTFEGNGTTGEDVLSHPHFAQFLRYFLFGPDLPDGTIDAFRATVGSGSGTSGMTLSQATAFVRQEVRTKNLDRDSAAEEFFKLAHELRKPDLARNVRDAALSVRRRR